MSPWPILLAFDHSDDNDDEHQNGQHSTVQITSLAILDVGWMNPLSDNGTCLPPMGPLRMESRPFGFWGGSLKAMSPLTYGVRRSSSSQNCLSLISSSFPPRNRSKNPRSWTHNSEQQLDMKKTVRIKLDNIWHNFKKRREERRINSQMVGFASASSFSSFIFFNWRSHLVKHS